MEVTKRIDSMKGMGFETAEEFKDGDNETFFLPISKYIDLKNKTRQNQKP